MAGGLGQNPNDPFYYTYEDLVALENAQQSSGGGLGGGGGNSSFGDLFGGALKGYKTSSDGYKKYSAPGGQGNIGSGIAGNNAAQDNGYETLDHSNYNDVSATIDDAGGAEATNPDSAANDSGSSGSWLGAIIGGVKGYQRGKQNYEEDPAMTSGEDGYGKYHHDARAEVGGGIGGAYLGWLGGAAGSDPAVEWSHPIMQDATRSVINTGDDMGGAYGAMVADPIGTMASGKYSWEQIKDSGDMFSSDPGTMGGEGVRFGDKVGGTYGSFMMNPIATVKSDDFDFKKLFKVF